MASPLLYIFVFLRGSQILEFWFVKDGPFIEVFKFIEVGFGEKDDVSKNRVDGTDWWLINMWKVFSVESS